MIILSVIEWIQNQRILYDVFRPANFIFRSMLAQLFCYVWFDDFQKRKRPNLIFELYGSCPITLSSLDGSRKFDKKKSSSPLTFSSIILSIVTRRRTTVYISLDVSRFRCWPPFLAKIWIFQTFAHFFSSPSVSKTSETDLYNIYDSFLFLKRIFDRPPRSDCKHSGRHFCAFLSRCMLLLCSYSYLSEINNEEKFVKRWFISGSFV